LRSADWATLLARLLYILLNLVPRVCDAGNSGTAQRPLAAASNHRICTTGTIMMSFATSPAHIVPQPEVDSPDALRLLGPAGAQVRKTPCRATNYARSLRHATLTLFRPRPGKPPDRTEPVRPSNASSPRICSSSRSRDQARPGKFPQGSSLGGAMPTSKNLPKSGSAGCKPRCSRAARASRL
jgi:hypothetical protein